MILSFFSKQNDHREVGLALHKETSVVTVQQCEIHLSLALFRKKTSNASGLAHRAHELAGEVVMRAVCCVRIMKQTKPFLFHARERVMILSFFSKQNDHGEVGL